MGKVDKIRFQKEQATFRRHGGLLRASVAFKNGISRKALYAMRDKGLIEPLSRGLFRLKGLSPLSQPDWVAVMSRIPSGVICLISALNYHKLTTHIPHEVHVAIPRGKKRPPRVDYPPVRVYQFSKRAYSEGIIVKKIDGVDVRIYDLEKTLADTFKFRNKIGMDVFLEALKIWRGDRHRNINALLRYARVNRVGKQIRPYLEA